MKPGRKADLDHLIFHDVESATIAGMKAMFDIDVLKNVADDMAFLKMMMQRRHVFDTRHPSQSRLVRARQACRRVHRAYHRRTRLGYAAEGRLGSSALTSRREVASSLTREQHSFVPMQLYMDAVQVLTPR
jgi:hypothetical protein